jgi:hypothetical protein
MEEFRIIDGTFKKNDALEILNTLIQNKIQFHHLRTLSEFELGKDSGQSATRIQELKETQRQISDLLNSEEFGSFRITGEIKIEKIQ